MKKAFTLIELLVVIVIITALVGIAVPVITGIRKGPVHHSEQPAQ